MLQRATVLEVILRKQPSVCFNKVVMRVLTAVLTAHTLNVGTFSVVPSLSDAPVFSQYQSLQETHYNASNRRKRAAEKSTRKEHADNCLFWREESLLLQPGADGRAPHLRVTQIDALPRDKIKREYSKHSL